MSLRSRIRKAREEVQEVTSRHLLPLASVQEVLQEHPLMSAFRLSINDVHSAILALHEIIPPTPEAACHTRTRTPDCIECGLGYLTLDAKEGNRVCNHCGAVDNLRTLNVVPEFRAPPPSPTKKAGKGIRGVPEWMIKQLSTNQSPSFSRFWDDLQDFNHLVSLPWDDLWRLDEVMKTLTRGGFSYEVRLVAGLLYHRVKPHFSDEAAIRRCVAKSIPIPVVAQLHPAPEFPCPTCGEKFHTAKTARWHCRLRS